MLFGQVLTVFSIVVAGVWSATQWTAAALEHQPSLGVPWFELFGTPVYHPRRLFEWWFLFDAYAPKVFDIGGAIASGSGLVYSPLARGRLTRPWGAATERSRTEPAGAEQNQVTAESDRKIIEAVASLAAQRGVSQVQIALAWLRRNPVVAAPIVGALKTQHIDDAIAALSIVLTDEEAASLEAPCTPRRDTQGVSDPILLARAVEAVTGFRADVT